MFSLGYIFNIAVIVIIMVIILLKGGHSEKAFGASYILFSTALT